MPTDEPITEAWLREHGFRPVLPRGDGRGFELHRLVVGDDILGGRPQFASPDDLCIDVAPVGGTSSWWFCWVHQVEPHRSIHVRDVRHTWELARLYEGLTGREWRRGTPLGA